MGEGAGSGVTKFTQEIADEICARIASGESLRQICDPETRDDFMPGRQTVLDWLDDDGNLAFRAKYARAREAQGDMMDDKILSTADECTSENAAAARVKIDAYKWRASKLRPKVYGDSVQVKHADSDGGQLPDPGATAARIAAILAAGASRRDGRADEG